MSTRAILSGAVGKAAELRTSKNGNSFATLSIRENVNGSTRWWQAIAFSESTIEALRNCPWASRSPSAAKSAQKFTRQPARKVE
jgi:hypothetical protein